MQTIETTTIDTPDRWRPDTGKGAMRMDLATQWMSRPHDQRFLSLSALEKTTRQRYDASREAVVSNRDMEMIAPTPKTPEDLSRFMVGLPDGGTVAPTNWAFGQLCGLAKSPAGHYRELPSQIVADALAYRLRFARSVESVKTYASGGELMAITGPDYGRIPDYEVVQAVRRVAGDGIGDTRWKVPGTLDWSTGIYDPRAPITKESTTLFASDRDVFLFLVDDLHPVVVGKTARGDDDLMFRGFYVKNSEVGSATLTLAAFYLRAVCCNRIMWGVEGFEELKIRHTRLAPDRFMQQAMPALRSFADRSSARLVEGVEQAKAAQVAKDKDDAIAFLKRREFTGRQIGKILTAVEREEGHEARSVWDMAQGITAVARDIPHQDERVKFELTAKTMLEKVAA